MSGRRARGVPPLRVAAAAALLLTVLAAVAGLAEALRHPATLDPVPEPAAVEDPREEVVCDGVPEARPGEPIIVDSGGLLDCPEVYDGHLVAYEGEVVGAVLERDDGSWVQLNDDPYAGDLGPLPSHRQFRGGNGGVGVHVPHALAGQVAWVGAHDQRGDVLAVVGVYHQSDPRSGEVAVIRVSAGEVVAAGGPIAHPPLADRRLAGGLLAAAALGLVLVGRLRARREADRPASARRRGRPGGRGGA